MPPFDLPSGSVLALLMATAAIAGLARGFSGFGGALIFIPLASAVIGPRVAAPLLLVIDGLTALPLIRPAWRGADRREVGVVASGALVGAPLGTLLLLVLDAEPLRWGMCGLALAMLLLLASGWRYHERPKLPLSVAVGSLSGLFSGIAQLGGPPIVAYWLGGAIPANRVRANIILFFAISSLISAMSYFVGGILTARVLTLAVLTAPAYGIGLFGGSTLFGRADEKTFRRICFGLIALAALLGLPLWQH